MITKEQIDIIEFDNRIKLPVDYIQFLIESDKNKYYHKDFTKVHQDGYLQKDSLVEFYNLDKLKKGLSCRDFLIEFQLHFDLSTDYVESDKLIHIAETLGGTIDISIDGKHKGKIYSVDHGDFGIIYLAENLEEFLLMIENK
jgi:hypothetical protein